MNAGANLIWNIGCRLMQPYQFATGRPSGKRYLIASTMAVRLSWIEARSRRLECENSRSWLRSPLTPPEYSARSRIGIGRTPTWEQTLFPREMSWKRCSLTYGWKYSDWKESAFATTSLLSAAIL